MPKSTEPNGITTTILVVVSCLITAAFVVGYVLGRTSQLHWSQTQLQIQLHGLQVEEQKLRIEIQDLNKNIQSFQGVTSKKDLK